MSTGVDEFPAMLARVPDLPTLCSTIESLDLGRTFDAVLLASTMINTDPGQRRSFLDTCRRHLDPTGVVIVQQTAPTWFTSVEPSEREVGGVRRVVTSVRRHYPQVDVAVEYHVGENRWTHAFDRWQITDLAGDLAASGLRFERSLSDDEAWFTARSI